MENRSYHQYATAEHNRDLWKQEGEYTHYCLGSCIAPGEGAEPIFGETCVNNFGENKSFWIIADENNCYVGAIWKPAF